MHTTSILSAIMGAMIATSAARAEDTDLERYLRTPEARQAATHALQAQVSKLPYSCSSLRMTPHGLFIVIRPTFSESGELVTGVWRQSWRGDGCGISRIFNIWTVAVDTGTPRVFASLPGSSIADPLLQKDGTAFAIAAATDFAPPRCKDIGVTDTSFVTYVVNGPLSATTEPRKRPWREDWTLDACGQSGVVSMHFTPDATGTAIFASPKKPAHSYANPHSGENETRVE